MPRKRDALRPQKTPVPAAPPEEQAFAEVVEMIQTARGKALAAVNTELIDLYWQVGEHISRRIGTEGWGKGTVAELSAFIQQRHPGMRAFHPRTFGECANSSTPTATSQNSQHC